MKKLYIAIAAVSMLFAFASCDRTDPYLFNGNPIDPSKGEGSYVTFGGDPAITIREDAGSFTIPVRVLGSHGDFSVTINAVDGTAKNNKHYKIAEPATGVLEFSAADTVKIVKFSLIKIDGYVEPGSVDFSVSIEAATGGVSLGMRREVTVTVNDADHPLSDILGAWDVTAFDSNSGAKSYRNVSYTMNLSAYEGDVTKVWCDYINEFGIQMKGYGINIGPVYGEVSADHSTISFPTGQEGGDMGSSNGGIVELTSGYIDMEGGKYYTKDIEAIVFTKQADGTYVCTDGILWVNDYVWPNYGGYFLGAENDCKTTWTKK